MRKFVYILLLIKLITLLTACDNSKEAIVQYQEEVNDLQAYIANFKKESEDIISDIEQQLTETKNEKAQV